MRTRCTDDIDDDIMDFAQALDCAILNDDFSTPLTKESKMATKKSTAQQPAAQAPAPAPVKKGKQAAAPAPAPETEKGVFGPRAVPDGHIGLAALAEELGMSPAAARRKLRASETSFKAEGQHGYYWKEGSKDLANVRKYLQTEPEKEKATA